MTGLRIITADERLTQRRGIKGVITGPSGIAKTSLAWTLDADTTLFLNAEAGDLSLEGWQGDMIDIRTWTQVRDLACFIGGPNPAFRPDQSYSQGTMSMCLASSVIRPRSTSTKRSSWTRSRWPRACVCNGPRASRRPSPSAPASLIGGRINA